VFSARGSCAHVRAGTGLVRILPQEGWGAVGGWSAMVLYVLLLGSTLFVRWRSASVAGKFVSNKSAQFSIIGGSDVGARSSLECTHA